MTTQTFVSAYSKKRKSPISFGSKSRTKQSHAKEADINFIMARYHKTGLLEHSRKHAPNYGFATSDDFHTSMNIITQAQEMFEDLPSPLRARFYNDPAQFLDFVSDDENREELIELGLVNPELTMEQLDQSQRDFEDSSESTLGDTDEVAESDSAEKES